jgi:hypothetical protein
MEQEKLETLQGATLDLKAAKGGVLTQDTGYNPSSFPCAAGRENQA